MLPFSPRLRIALATAETCAKEEQRREVTCLDIRRVWKLPLAWPAGLGFQGRLGEAPRAKALRRIFRQRL